MKELIPADAGDGFVLQIELSHKGRPVGEETASAPGPIEADGDATVAATLNCTGVQALPGGQTTSATAITTGRRTSNTGSRLIRTSVRSRVVPASTEPPTARRGSGSGSPEVFNRIGPCS